jgi:hypothetical protein
LINLKVNYLNHVSQAFLLKRWFPGIQPTLHSAMLL